MDGFEESNISFIKETGCGQWYTKPDMCVKEAWKLPSNRSSYQIACSLSVMSALERACTNLSTFLMPSTSPLLNPRESWIRSPGLYSDSIASSMLWIPCLRFDSAVCTFISIYRRRQGRSLTNSTPNTLLINVDFPTPALPHTRIRKTLILFSRAIAPFVQGNSVPFEKASSRNCSISCLKPISVVQ